MPTWKRPHACRCSVLSLALLAAAAHAQDSGAGTDLQFGNWLDPSGRIGWRGCDPDGGSWLTAEPKRTPTGFLYGCSPERPALAALGSRGWTWSGDVGLGYLHVGGDTANSAWRRFRAPGNGAVLQADFSLRHAADGRYADVRLSRLDRDNQYYRAVFGQAGRYKVQAFARSTPNVLSGNARAIWDGVGSRHLTLKPGLSAAASTPAQVAALSAAQPLTTLSVVRDKQGVSINYLLNPRWTTYASLSHEQRKGARPFGGPFFFNYPFADNGGIYEIPRPIDDSTLNFTGGARFAGNLWRSDVSYTGSFFRHANRSYRYDVPFAVSSVAGAHSPPLYQGSFAYEPDNDYHRVGATFSRRLPGWKGDLTLAAALTTMRQNDRLLPPMDCQGAFGQDLAPPFMADCGHWNTTAALSRDRADLAINNQKVDARLVLQPMDGVTWRSTARYLREDYAGTYWSHNPLTDQWGYIAENGAQGAVVPGEMGLWDRGANSSVLTRIRNLPLDKETREVATGLDWRPSTRNTLGATYSFTWIERAHREVATTRDNTLKLTWNNRSTGWLNLRANYTWLDRSGSRYYYDPYAFTFSSALPDFVTPAGGLAPHTVSALRKYDIASRTQHKLDLMATFVLPRDMTLYASFRGDRNHYDAQIGRQRLDSYASSVQWEWQPRPDTTAGAWYGHDRSKLVFANVNDAAGSDPALGGTVYPLANRWWMDDEQRNHYAGLSLNQRMGRATLDLAWNWTYSRGRTGYRMSSPDALTTPADAALASGRYPLMVYRINSFTAGLTLPLGTRTRLRLFDTWERGDLSDWHYFGFADTLVYDHRVYTDSGPSRYNANLVGMMVEVAL
ncbi:MtrB/PioB family outer membrane beta-barrel protein [Stenotrophomonas mori]|uniref:MtrB/PioB family outer membrane beta-barrel protein n=1 Tax=Stenotrophomonas mori TaxID=2871096 RepID=A0ABT0SEF5_9GAMM|nr:MtrB/PioB family outer membrane beta-barrel protein [Stenotrophomonas mori]MCL7713700.1 MtrB/PioB family outer membrane beta-barrel protein [Stenotrophomonas mori]